MKLQDQVKEFHEAFGIVINTTPTVPDRKTMSLRYALIEEELDELGDAIEDEDIVALADALGDLAYVVYGAAVSFGIDLEAITDEIHRSNMTKVGGVKDDRGKLIKPATYSPANLLPILESQGYSTSG